MLRSPGLRATKAECKRNLPSVAMARLGTCFVVSLLAFLRLTVDNKKTRLSHFALHTRFQEVHVCFRNIFVASIIYCTAHLFEMKESHRNHLIEPRNETSQDVAVHFFSLIPTLFFRVGIQTPEAPLANTQLQQLMSSILNSKIKIIK